MQRLALRRVTGYCIKGPEESFVQRAIGAEYAFERFLGLAGELNFMHVQAGAAGLLGQLSCRPWLPFWPA